MNFELKKIEKDGKTYDLHVMWSIHNKCNYACSYCPDDLHNGSISWIKLNDMKGFINKIEEHYVQKLGFKNILFSFTGGEPTLWRDFQEFLEYINQKGFRVGLTTNASVSVKFWERVSTYFDYICMSYHAESANNEHFVKTYQYLHDHPETVIPSVRIMMHKDPKLWEKCEEVLKEIKKFPNYTYQCVHILESYGHNPTKYNYGSEEKEQFLDQNAFQFQFNDNSKVFFPKVDFHYKATYKDGTVEKLDENKLISNNNVNFKDWSCYIGIEQLFIHHSGWIKRSGCNVGGYLGHINDLPNISFPLNPIKCTANGCYCPTDIRISKFAPDTHFNKIDTHINIKKVTSNNSTIKFRVHYKYDSEKSCGEEVVNISKLAQIVKHLIISKNLKENEIVIHFEVHTLSNENILLSLSDLLSDVHCLVTLEIKNLSTSIINPAPLSLFNKIEIHLSNIEHIKFIHSFSFLSDTNTSGNIRFLVHLGKWVVFQQALKRLIDMFQSQTFRNFDIEIFDQNYEFKNDYLKSFFKNETNISFHYPPLKQNIYLLNEDVIASDEKVYGIEALKKMSEVDFVSWTCYQGINNISIDFDSKIYSSSCKQRIHLADLETLNIDVFSELLLNNTTDCQQKTCLNRYDNYINKSKDF